MCDVFGTKKAAKRQAAATMQAADLQVKSDNLQAQAAVQQQQTSIAQKAATDQAQQLLSKPIEQVDVRLGTTPEAEIDPVSKRRRTARSSFMSNASSGSGIKI